MRGKIEDDKTQQDSVGWERIETRDKAWSSEFVTFFKSGITL